MKLSPKINESLKKLNKRNTTIIISVVALILCVGLFFLQKKAATPVTSTAHKEDIKFVPFSTVGDFTDTATNVAISDLNESQHEQSEANEKTNKLLTAKLHQVQQEVKALKDGILSDKKAAEDKAATKPAMRSPVPTAEGQPLSNAPIGPHPVNSNAKGNTSAFGEQGVSQPMAVSAFKGISDFTFNLPKSAQAVDDEKKGCTLGHCILPGTFARAVMIGGADTNASVNGQSNTTPVVFRVLKQGVMPNNYRVDIRGCFVIGTAYGDISSERGEVKLTNISCIMKGKIINKPISLGTAYDISGKEGIRGIPVMRNGSMLWYAGLSGMASGVGSALAQQYTTTATSPLGTTSSVDNSKIFQYGGATGAQTALGKLAGYYIKRADQYHPVIQLNPGTKVDLMFLSPVTLRQSDKDDNDDASHSPSQGISGTLSRPEFGSNISPALASKIKAQMAQQLGGVSK